MSKLTKHPDWCEAPVRLHPFLIINKNETFQASHLKGFILSSSCDCIPLFGAQQQDDEENYELKITNYE